MVDDTKEACLVSKKQKKEEDETKNILDNTQSTQWKSG